MQLKCLLQLDLHVTIKPFGQDSDAVLVTLPGTYVYLSIVKTHILDAQSQAFHLPHTGSVEHARNQAIGAAYLRKQGYNLGLCQDDRQAAGTFCANNIIKPVKFLFQDFLVQEKNCGQGLIPG